MYILLYYSVGIGLLLVLIGLCRWQPGLSTRPRPVGSDALFLGVVVLTLVLMRLPSLCFNEELNVDESQVIASGITLLKDPVYGRSVDGTTIGPLNSYVLLLPHVLGLPMDYSSARLVALLLILGSIFVFYRTLRRIVSPLASRISTLFVTLLFAWTANDSFLHFSSELTSVLLLNAVFYLSLRVVQSPKSSPVLLGWIGLLAGLIPYGKLQALPIAGVILLTLTVYVVRNCRAKAVGLLIACGAGFVLPTVLVFGVAYYYDVSDYYINFYFLSNLLTYQQIYADVPLVHATFWAKLASFPHFVWHHTDFFSFVLLPFFITGGSLWVLNRGTGQPRRLREAITWPEALIGLTIAAAGWAVIVPGTEFGHHLLLLIFPMSLATGLWLDRLLDGRVALLTSIRMPAVLLAFCTAGLLLSSTIVQSIVEQLLVQRPTSRTALRRLRPTRSKTGWLYLANPSLVAFPTRTRIVVSPVARIVRQYALPTDQLAVWGWHCSYYVETQLAQGVSEAHTQRSILPNRMQAMYLKRYASELDKNRPVIFLDAVGKNSLSLVLPSQRSDHFGAVQAVLCDKYQFVGDVDDVRIYVRSDYVAHRRQLASALLTSGQHTW